MKIVQLIYSLSSGGAERFVVDLSNELVSRGHEVYLITMFDSKNPRYDFYGSLLNRDVVRYDMMMPGKMSIACSFRLKKLIDSISPDIVHSHLAILQYMLPMLLSPKYKYVHTLHSVAHKTIKDRLKRIYKYLYRSGRVHPVTISEMCHNSYLDYFHIDGDTMIPNGRTPVVPSVNIVRVKAELSELKPSPDAKIFINVARCDALKNHKLLIGAFNKLHSEGLKFVLLIIGDGYDTSVLGRELKDLAGKNIYFLGEKNNVGDYLLCGDAFCLSSTFEGLPISLLEALSAGCVPICTKAGGIVDVVKDGVDGYLADGMTTEDYITAVKRFIDNPIPREVAVKSYKASYSMKKCAESYEEAYWKLLSPVK